MTERGFDEEMKNLVHDAEAWKLVDLETSRLLRTRVPGRILRPRPVLTLRKSKKEVKRRRTLQGLKDPDVLDLAWEDRTASPSVSTSGRAMLLQTLASCK